MKHILFSLITLGIFVPVFFASAQDQAPNTPSATVGVTCTGTQEGNVVKASCDFTNGAGSKADIRYGLELGSRVGETALDIVDTQIGGETLAFGDRQTIHRDITYTVPGALNGIHVLLIKVHTAEGMLLGLNQVMEVVATPIDGSVAIVPGSCFLTIPTETDDKRYTLEQGVDISTSEELFVNCAIANPGTKAVTITASIATYRRNIYGEKVPLEDKNPGALTLAPGEQRSLALKLPRPDVPQAYDATLSLMVDGKPVSGVIRLHYVIQGTSATIQDIFLDKSSYKKNDVASVSTWWSGSADSFYGSRSENTPSTAATYTINIQDGKGRACGEVNGSISDGKLGQQYASPVEVPISQNCIDPKTTVTIFDTAGAVLVSKTVSITSTDISFLDSILGNPYYLGGLAVGILLLFLVIVYCLVKWRRSRQDSFLTPPSPTILSSLVFIVVAATGIFLSGGVAQAATGVECSSSTQCLFYTDYYNPSFQEYFYLSGQGAINKTTYSPGESIAITAALIQHVCSNGNVPLPTTIRVWSDSGQSRDFSYPAGSGFANQYGNFPASMTPGAHWVRFQAEVEGGGAATPIATINYTVTAPPATPPPAPPAAPSSLTATCNAAGTAVTLNWTAATGATTYWPRIGATSGQSIQPQCSNFGWQSPDGATCVPNPDNGYGGARTVSNFPIVAGRTYNAWVHSGNAAGPNWSSSRNTSFTCSAPAPDLLGSTVSPTSVVAGTANTYTVGIRNQGNATSGATTFGNSIQYDDDSSTTDWELYGSIDNIPLSAITAGSTKTITGSITFPSAGTWYMRGCGDPLPLWNGVIAESDEVNNCGPWRTITVTAPAASNSLKLCQNNCSSGALRGSNTSTGSFSLARGGTQNLAACWNTSTSCDTASGDVSGTATWGEGGSSPISLSGTAPKTVNANNTGTESVSATYSGQTASSNVTVTCVPTVDCSNAPGRDNYCQNQNFNVDNGCGASISCSGTKTCNYNWQEVAP